MSYWRVENVTPNCTWKHLNMLKLLFTVISGATANPFGCDMLGASIYHICWWLIQVEGKARFWASAVAVTSRHPESRKRPSRPTNSH